MTVISPSTDWYDWLAENEEITGGKVRVLGLPCSIREDQGHRNNLFSQDDSGRAKDRRKDWPAESRQSDMSPDASFQRVLADLSAHDNARFDRENRKPDIRPNTLDWHAGDGGQPSSQHGCTTANIQNATRECRPDHGVNASTRVGNFYTYMVRREMQATEDRIMERVMAKTDLQSRQTEQRLNQHINQAMLGADSLNSRSDTLRHAVRRLRSSSHRLGEKLSELTTSLRDELAYTNVRD